MIVRSTQRVPQLTNFVIRQKLTKIHYYNTKCYLLNTRHFSNVLHLFKKEITRVLQQKIKNVFKKITENESNNEHLVKPYVENKETPVDKIVNSSLNTALMLYEKHNIKYMESLYKEILTCVDVLNYKEEEVDKKLNELQNYLKSITNNIDPYTFCEKKIKNIDKHIYNIIKTGYKNIDEFTTYIHCNKGKRFRIVVGILLINILSLLKQVNQRSTIHKRVLERRVERHKIRELDKEGANLDKSTRENGYTAKEKKNFFNSRQRYIRKSILKKQIDEEILENQSKMIAASEIIHMGSLLHDDVVDESTYRRGVLALHKKFSNKISVLSGDFLLARAGSVLSSFGNPEICKRFSYIVESLIKGEFLQTNLNFNNIEDALKIYLIKTYHKTASLFSHAFACVAMLAFMNEQIIKHCFYLGLHIGMAFQLYDDFLDFKPSGIVDKKKKETKIDKWMNTPLLHDLQNNIKTAPLFFSYNYNPKDILSLINKKYLTKHDISNILFYIKNTNSMKKNELCSLMHVKRACDILSLLISQCRNPKPNEKNFIEKEKIKENSTMLINLVLAILSRPNK